MAAICASLSIGYELKLFLKSKNIDTLIQWSGKPIHHFKKLGFNQNLPNTDKIFKQILLLPINQYIADKQVMYVIKCIKNFYQKTYDFLNPKRVSYFLLI